MTSIATPCFVHETPSADVAERIRLRLPSVKPPRGRSDTQGRRPTPGSSGPGGRAGAPSRFGGTPCVQYTVSVTARPPFRFARRRSWPHSSPAGRRRGPGGGCPAPGAGRRTSVSGKHQHPVDPPGDARIRVSELLGQHRLRRTLPGDRTQETPDGRRADRGVRSVGRRPRTAVMLRPGRSGHQEHCRNHGRDSDPC